MSKSIVDLESKKTLNKTDVILVTDASGNMSKMAAPIFKDQIGANTVLQKFNAVSQTAAGASFCVGSNDEYTASIVLYSSGGASFDKKKKGSLFSVSNVLLIKDGSTSIKGKSLEIDTVESVKILLGKEKTFFSVSKKETILKVDDDGVFCSSISTDSLLSKSLQVKSGSDSIYIGASNGKFTISATGKNSKKEVVPFVSLTGTENSFLVSINGKDIMSASEKVLSVSGSIHANIFAGEVRTNKISAESLSVCYGKKEAFTVNAEGMGTVDFKSDVSFSGGVKLHSISDKDLELITSEVGTVIFNSTKKQFQGFNGEKWVIFK